MPSSTNSDPPKGKSRTRAPFVFVLCDPRDDPAWLRQRLALHLGDRVEMVVATSPLKHAKALEGAEVMFVWRRSPIALTRVLSRAGSLRWLHMSSAGMDGVPFREIERRGLLLSGSRGVLAEPIADHAIAQFLALTRDIPRALALQADRRWEQWESRPLEHMTIAIFGFGAIGTAVAKRAHAFGVRVLGISRRATSSPWADAVVPQMYLGAVLEQADALVIAAPDTDATHGLFDGPTLDLLPPGALLINVSRASIVDEAALLERLESGQVGGASLDVHFQEPLLADSPWWSAPNTLITPHIAAMSSDWSDRLLGHFASNLDAFITGAALKGMVDPAIGY